MDHFDRLQTVRFTPTDGYNVKYYAFFPANTNVPTIHDIYPNGVKIRGAAEQAPDPARGLSH